MEIGKKIKARRIELDMTQAQLAEKIHVSRSTISNWEIGRNYPDIQMIVDLSYCLDISIDTLLKGDDVIVTHITNDTRLRKKQKNYIIGLVVLLILIMSYIGYNSILHYEKWIDDPKQIKKIEITDTRVNIDFDLPPYLTFSGFATSPQINDEHTLELYILTSFNYHSHQKNNVSIHLSHNLFPNKVTSVKIKQYEQDKTIATKVK
ncbi:helix-turn-helix domain-containing protein [Vagococcus sp. PNs007]|uniref:Helix-turn-helix domain-containing protein n=1 Tax=Vagococcus proximus TaxID=2991417 RepID=A0ABT5X0Z0_9ENTE|nr:helix-turn-helix transcriptional regulator [Vagococcus proximus]MDF0479669.1 helix-turn-helix domain-containing protein [Vagococcus proximus]